MSHEADELDIKIGLLIQNRISLQVIYNIIYFLRTFIKNNMFALFRMLLVIK